MKEKKTLNTRKITMTTTTMRTFDIKRLKGKKKGDEKRKTYLK